MNSNIFTHGEIKHSYMYFTTINDIKNHNIPIKLESIFNADAVCQMDWSLSIRYFMKLQNDAKFFILEMITIKTPQRR